MTSETTIAMTPAQLIDRALESADRLRHYQPSQREYSSLAQAAIADVLTALAITITGQDKPVIPGLPAGWHIEATQSMTGSRFWAYELTSPGGHRHTSPFQWKRPEGAMAAGIGYARELDGQVS